MSIIFARSALAIMLALSTLLLTGCAPNPAKNPLIHTKAGFNSDIYALKATHRLAYVQGDVAGGIRGICSEPPPDVMSAIKDDILAELSANLKEGTAGLDSGEAKAKFTRNFNIAVEQIYIRSQGVQLFRDGAFMLCLAYLNGAIQPDIGNRVATAVNQVLPTDSDTPTEKVKQINELSNQLTEKLSPILLGAEHTKENQIKALFKQSLPESLKQDSDKLADSFIKQLSLQNSFNYTTQFNSLLAVTKEVLAQELELLYRYSYALGKASAEPLKTPEPPKPPKTGNQGGSDGKKD